MTPISSLTERQKRNFWSKVHIGESGDCWEWMGLISRTGYGRVSLQNREYLTHRVAYFLYTGVDPLENLVTQTCGDHSCCNPAHLQLKTKTTLSVSQIQYIREQAAQGVRPSTLAKQYSITRSTIYDIVNQRTWKDI